MPFNLIASGAARSPTQSDVTSPTLDPRGANLIVLVVNDSGANPLAVLDSESNVWTPRTEQVEAGIERTRLYDCVNPVTAAVQTFSANGSPGSYPAIAVLCFSGGHN